MSVACLQQQIVQPQPIAVNANLITRISCGPRVRYDTVQIYSSRGRQKCKLGAASGGAVTRGTSKAATWMRKARACKVGRYTPDSLAEQGNNVSPCARGADGWLRRGSACLTGKGKLRPLMLQDSPQG